MRMGGRRGKRRATDSCIICTFCLVLHGTVSNRFTVSGHFVNKSQHHADPYWSVNASFSTHVQPGLCFFVGFPHLAANLWPRSPPMGQIFLESCNLRVPHMFEAAPFCQKSGFPRFLAVTSATKWGFLGLFLNPNTSSSVNHRRCYAIRLFGAGKLVFIDGLGGHRGQEVEGFRLTKST